MEERKFLIYGCPNDYKNWNVTESEIRKRIILITKLDACIEEDMRRGVDILIHGEAKEPEKPTSTK